MTNTNLESYIETSKLVTNIANHARDNQSFRAKLMSSPHATIDEYAGKEVFSSNENIVITQPGEDEVYFFIPRKVDVDDLELSDLELEAVAGGSDFIAGVIVGGIAIGVGWAISKL